MLDAFNYNNPDKIPVVFGWSDSGLYVHREREKLIDLFAKYQPDNHAFFTDIPEPLPETINENIKSMID